LIREAYVNTTKIYSRFRRFAAKLSRTSDIKIPVRRSVGGVKRIKVRSGAPRPGRNCVP